jgi:hypothetical protein
MKNNVFSVKIYKIKILQIYVDAIKIISLIQLIKNVKVK